MAAWAVSVSISLQALILLIASDHKHVIHTILEA